MEFSYDCLWCHVNQARRVGVTEIANVIILKGQGNYDGLSPMKKNIYFLSW